MGLRLLIALLLFVLGWRWLQRRLGPPGEGGRAAPPSGAGRPGRGPEAMVACAHCGLHLPRSDALLDDEGRHFCSGEHLRAGPGGEAR